MAENLYFKRTSKKLKESDIDDVLENKKFTHYYHKFDGTHVDLHYYVDAPIKMITREGNDIAHLVPYLVQALQDNPLMEAYQGVFACELVNLHLVKTNPKDSWSGSRRALGVKEFKGKETVDFVHCVIYDKYESHRENIEHLPYLERLYKHIPKALGTTVYAEFVSGVVDLTGFYVPQIKQIDNLKEDWEQHILIKKREGFVLFNLDDMKCKWEHTFHKLKPDLDIDCVVIGYKLGTKGGQHEGKVGSLNIAVYKDGVLFSVGSCSGMKQEERDMWTERMLNKDNTQYVVQVKASEVTTAGKLRFASYVRERTDKKPEECLYEQLD